MIRYIENGDLFASRADAFVNTVNCVGVMGKGLALQFKQRFPEYFLVYKQVCDAGQLRPGRPGCVRLVLHPAPAEPRPAMVMFPTKDDWKKPSKIEWIDQGLAYLKTNYQEWGITSLAMPPLGCGLGGLDWNDVYPLIEHYFADDALEVEVYAPAGTALKAPIQAAVLTPPAPMPVPTQASFLPDELPAAQEDAKIP